MPARIRIEAGPVSLTAELNDSASAKRLVDQLPLEIAMTRWGDEYYGDAGLAVDPAPDARSEMGVGELAVWPEGRAVCIFFGPTPVSQAEEPRAISNVNPIGRILEDPSALRGLASTIRVRFEQED